MPLDFSKYKFRCSSLGALMTDPQSKSNLDLYNEEVAKLEELNQKLSVELTKQKEGKPPTKTLLNLQQKIVDCKENINVLSLAKDEPKLSATCISKLLEIYIFEKYGRRYDITSRYLIKGNEVEDKSITLVSELDNDFYAKNKVRKENDYISGECDLEKEDEIEDIKSSWDLRTFLKKTIEGLDKNYWWQGQGYMWLWGKEKYRLSYCLIDTPEALLEDEFNRLKWEIGSKHEDTGLFNQACEEIRLNSTYPDLEVQERVFRYRFKFVPEAIEALKERIELCRKWLNDYSIKEEERYGKEVEFTEVDFFTPKEEKKTQINININSVTIASEDKKSDANIEEKVLDSISNIVGEDVKKVEYSLNIDELKEKIEKEQREEIEKQAFQPSFNSLLKEIEDCKTLEDIIELRKKHKKEYDEVEEIKNAFVAKRESFTTPPPAAKPATPPPAIKPTLPPTPAAAPPQQEPAAPTSTLEQQVKDFVSKCEKSIEIKEYVGKSPEITKLLKENKELRKFVNDIGESLVAKEKIEQQKQVQQPKKEDDIDISNL